MSILSQGQRKVLLAIIPNEKWLSSRSIDDEAGHPKTPRLAHYSKPTLIDALDLELPATLEGAITICGHGRVVEFLQVSQETYSPNKSEDSYWDEIISMQLVLVILS